MRLIDSTAPLKPIKKNGRFYFDHNHKPESLFLKTVPSTVASIMISWWRHYKKPALQTSYRHLLALRTDVPTITWIGHATFLIQVGGVNILFDPIWGSPSWVHKRLIAPGIPLDQLPPIDWVLLSHNHRDHMDYPTIQQLLKNNPSLSIGLPDGDKRWIAHYPIKNIKECLWEETFSLTETHEVPLTATFVPAHHWSQRSWWDKNCSLWGGWVITYHDYTIYFAGDTAFSLPCFERIAYLFPHIDVALLPIAPGRPHRWMKHTHMDAMQAGEAFLALKAHQFIPMHWGTYAFGFDKPDEPIKKLVSWWQNNQNRLGNKHLHTPAPGQPVVAESNRARRPMVSESSLGQSADHNG